MGGCNVKRQALIEGVMQGGALEISHSESAVAW